MNSILVTPALALFLLSTFSGSLIHGKVYTRCDLARELKYVHQAPGYQIATWVCIAQHESQYNTSALGHPNSDKSTDHGIFQINDRYWCSPPGKGKACGLPCSKFQDDDITDDYACVQKIFKEHKHLSGDGFNAWAVYKPFCQGNKSDEYIKGCFDFPEEAKIIPEEGSSQPISSPFAHGFFGGIVEISDKIISPTEEPFFNPQTSEISISTPSDSHFVTPTTTTTSRTTVFFPSTSKPPFSHPNAGNNLFIYNPTTIKPSTFTPLVSRSNFFSSPATFFTPTSTFFPPTTTKTVFQTTPASRFVNKPVFIFNGVKWYK